MDGWKCSSSPPCLHGGCRVGASHRLRGRCSSGARTSHRAAKGDGHPCGSGRCTKPPSPPNVNGKPSIGSARRWCWVTFGELGCEGSRDSDPARVLASRKARDHERSSLCVHVDGVSFYHSCIRARARVGGGCRGHQQIVERRRFARPISELAPLGTYPCYWRSGPRFCTSHRCRLADSKFPTTSRSASRISGEPSAHG